MYLPAEINGINVTTVEALQKMAEEYNADAMYLYAEMLWEGDGIKRNATEAVWRFKYAALLGSAEAFYRLGECYQVGGGVYKNLEYAATLFQASYALGYSKALLAYANMMLESDDEDMKEVGLVIMRFASLQGDEDADYYIEEYYPEAEEYDGILNISDEEKKQWIELGKTDIIDETISLVEKTYMAGGSLNEGGFLYNMNYKFGDVCEYIGRDGMINLDFNQSESDGLNDYTSIECKPDKELINDIAFDNNSVSKKISAANKAEAIGVSVGTAEGIVANANTLYDMRRLHGTQPHGHAAERANHLKDLLSGKNAKHLGGNNAEFGPDRRVNGMLIQTKYCESFKKSIDACFRPDKGYVYCQNGEYMHVEVPRDQYEDAREYMAERWRRGELPGITEQEAKDLVLKGGPTYQQAKRLAQAGTVESITFDAVNGAIVGAYSFGITSVFTYAVSIWNGVDSKEALKLAINAGIKSAGTAFVTSIISAQLTRAIASSAVGNIIEGAGDALFNVLGKKAGTLYVNAMKTSLNIYGAESMKHATAGRVFKNQVICGGVSIAILSAPDVFKLFQGKMSGKQFTKNVLSNTASVAGASIGQTAGKMVGQMMFGPIGGMIGGLAGAALGGSIARHAAGYVLDELIEDDSKAMLEILQRVFYDLAQEYVLNKAEAEFVANCIEQYVNIRILENMYASYDRFEFAKEFLEPFCDKAVNKRQYIEMPSNDVMVTETRNMLEVEYDELQKKQIA